MSKIWLDVTTILGWQRPSVGVVRVEAECASACIKNANEDIHFCRFHKSVGFQEVKTEDVISSLERIQGNDNNKVPDIDVVTPVDFGNQSSSVLTKKQRIKLLFLKAINLLPAKLRIATLGFARNRKVAFDALIRSYRELRHAFSLFLRPPNKNESLFVPSAHSVSHDNEKKTTPFTSSDVYISLGLDWEQKDLVYLYEQKKKLRFKVVLFCYDLIPVKLPQLCVGDVAAAFSRYFTNVAWCADEVLCISECTKYDLQILLTELGAPIPSMSVVNLGCQLPTITSKNVESDVKQILDQPYILFVSTIERRKNHETLYRAYTRLIDQGEKNLPLLVFVGMQGWGVSDFMLDIQLDPRTKGYIIILNKVTDADLVRLYKNTLFTVYPSLYEGWGLPVAESLAAGKFCLASNAASIPEVGTDLIEYLDPWNVQEWAAKLSFYIQNRDVIEEKERKIRNEFIQTEWKYTAGQVLSHAISLSTMSEKGLGYEERLQHLYSNLLKEGDHCIDVGAHNGRHSIPMATKVGRRGSILAFESNPDMAKMFKDRVYSLSLVNIEVNQYALPHENNNNLTSTKEITVQVRRLDKFNNLKPRFIKIDTEGSEFDILLGAKNTLMKYHPVIAFKFKTSSSGAYDVNAHKLYEYLSGFSYTLLNISGEEYNEEVFTKNSIGQNYQDYVACVPEDLNLVKKILKEYNPGFGEIKNEDLG